MSVKDITKSVRRQGRSPPIRTLSPKTVSFSTAASIVRTDEGADSDATAGRRSRTDITQTVLVIAPEVLGRGSQTPIDSSTMDDGHRTTTAQLEDQSIHTPNRQEGVKNTGVRTRRTAFDTSKNLLSQPAEG